MSTTLDIVRIPVLNDNYVWLMREPQSGSVGVVDPAVAGPVLAEAASVWSSLSRLRAA
jgi:hydroxyacylglutathione hydrolase